MTILFHLDNLLFVSELSSWDYGEQLKKKIFTITAKLRHNNVWKYILNLIGSMSALVERYRYHQRTNL